MVMSLKKLQHVAAKEKLSRTEKVGLLVFERFLYRLFTILSSALLVRLFSEELFGTYRQLIFLGNIFGTFFDFAVPSSLMFFIPHATDWEEKRNFAGQTILFAGVMGLLAYLFLSLLATPIAKAFDNPHLSFALSIYAIAIGLEVAGTFYTQLMYALERIRIAMIYNVVSQMLHVVVLALAFYFRWDLMQFLVAITILRAIRYVRALVIARMALGGFRFRLSLQRVREQLTFAAPIAVSQFVNRFSYDLDLTMVSYFFSTVQFAIYSVGAFELPIVNIIRKSTTTVSMPQLVALFRDNRIEEMLELFREMARKTALIALPCFVFLFMMAEQFITVLYTEKYLESIGIFRTYLFLIPLTCASFGALVQATGNTRPVMTFSLFYIGLSAVLNCIFIQLFGLIGPAIATVIGKVYLPWAFLRILTRTTHRPITDFFPFREYLRILVASIAVMVPVMLFSKMMIAGAFIQLIIAAIFAVSLYFIVCWYFQIFTEDDLHHLRKWVGKKWLPKKRPLKLERGEEA
jgi:O-antigen/teichoic acid export membrane protein